VKQADAQCGRLIGERFVSKIRVPGQTGHLQCSRVVQSRRALRVARDRQSMQPESHELLLPF
jgi:hypothetical protein